MTDSESAFGPTRGAESEVSRGADPEARSAALGRARGRRRVPDVGRPGRWRGRAGTRPLAARVLTLAIVAAVAIPLTVTGCSSASSSSSAQPNQTSSSAQPNQTPVKLKTPRNCGSSGCAMVQLSRSLPALTILYGASCSGIYGSWFFNAVEAGGKNALRPSYALEWSFKGGKTSARPSARSINVPSTTDTTVTISLSDGNMKLSGVRKPNGSVTATGTLVVELTGTASSPTLTFTESGLFAAEQSLGLTSPFNVRGRPLVVPIQHVRSLRGC